MAVHFMFVVFFPLFFMREKHKTKVHETIKRNKSWDKEKYCWGRSQDPNQSDGINRQQGAAQGAGKGQKRLGGWYLKGSKEDWKRQSTQGEGDRRDRWTVTEGKLLWERWEMYLSQDKNQILDPPCEEGKGIIKTGLQGEWRTNGIFSRNRLIKCRWDPSCWKMLFITWDAATQHTKKCTAAEAS